MAEKILESMIGKQLSTKDICQALTRANFSISDSPAKSNTTGTTASIIVDKATALAIDILDMKAGRALSQIKTIDANTPAKRLDDVKFMMQAMNAIKETSSYGEAYKKNEALNKILKDGQTFPDEKKSLEKQIATYAKEMRNKILNALGASKTEIKTDKSQINKQEMTGLMNELEQQQKNLSAQIKSLSEKGIQLSNDLSRTHQDVYKLLLPHQSKTTVLNEIEDISKPQVR